MSLQDKLKEMQSEEQAKNLAAAQKEITALVDATYSAKQAVSAAEEKFKGLKKELLTLMEASGVDKIIGKECSATVSIKSSVSVPKDVTKKKELFEYIRANHGGEVLGNMLTINARSFSSWYNAEVQSKVDAGEIDFKLPMLEPYEMTSIGLRKIAKKSK